MLLTVSVYSNIILLQLFLLMITWIMTFITLVHSIVYGQMNLILSHYNALDYGKQIAYLWQTVFPFNYH